MDQSKKFSESRSKKLVSWIGYALLLMGIVVLALALVYLVYIAMSTVMSVDASAVSYTAIQDRLETQYSEVAVSGHREDYWSLEKMEVCDREYSVGYIFTATNANGHIVNGMVCIRFFSHRIDIVIPSP